MQLLDEAIPEAFGTLHPDVVVGMVTVRMWRTACRMKGGTLAPTDPRFFERLVADYDAVTAGYAGAGVARVLWVLAPIPTVFYSGEEAALLDPARYDAYAAAIEEVVAAIPAGRMSSISAAGWRGSRRHPERPDGLHWSPEAAARLANDFLGPVVVTAGDVVTVPTGLVLGRFDPPHRGHSFLIDDAAGRCERLAVYVNSGPRDAVPGHLRARWLAELHPSATVVEVVHDLPTDFGDEDLWRRWIELFREHWPFDTGPDIVCSNDPYAAELARRLGATAVVVDAERLTVPISATMIRGRSRRPPRHARPRGACLGRGGLARSGWLASRRWRRCGSSTGAAHPSRRATSACSRAGGAILQLQAAAGNRAVTGIIVQRRGASGLLDKPLALASPTPQVIDDELVPIGEAPGRFDGFVKRDDARPWPAGRRRWRSSSTTAAATTCCGRPQPPSAAPRRRRRCPRGGRWRRWSTPTNVPTTTQFRTTFDHAMALSGKDQEEALRQLLVRGTHLEYDQTAWSANENSYTEGKVNVALWLQVAGRHLPAKVVPTGSTPLPKTAILIGKTPLSEGAASVRTTLLHEARHSYHRAQTLKLIEAWRGSQAGHARRVERVVEGRRAGGADRDVLHDDGGHQPPRREVGPPRRTATSTASCTGSATTRPRRRTRRRSAQTQPGTSTSA